MFFISSTVQKNYFSDLDFWLGHLVTLMLQQIDIFWLVSQITCPSGCGIPTDPQEACWLFQLAADQWYNVNQCWVGDCYEMCPDSWWRWCSKYWRLKSAEQGENTTTMNNVGSSLCWPWRWKIMEALIRLASAKLCISFVRLFLAYVPTIHCQMMWPGGDWVIRYEVCQVQCGIFLWIGIPEKALDNRSQVWLLIATVVVRSSSR